jgi:hypothetical protein
MDFPYPAFQVFHGEFFVTHPAALGSSYLDWVAPVVQSLKLHLSSTNATVSSTCISSYTHLLASYYFNANMVRIYTNKQYIQRIQPDEEIVARNKFANDFNARALASILIP